MTNDKYSDKDVFLLMDELLREAAVYVEKVSIRMYSDTIEYIRIRGASNMCIGTCS
jgi:hypothetical protein